MTDSASQKEMYDQYQWWAYCLRVLRKLIIKIEADYVLGSGVID